MTVGGRQNPVCEWGQQMIGTFLQIRPDIGGNGLLAVGANRSRLTVGPTQ